MDGKDGLACISMLGSLYFEVTFILFLLTYFYIDTAVQRNFPNTY